MPDYNSGKKEIINPWLSELIGEFLSVHSKEEFFDEYNRLSELRTNICWDDFIARKAMRDAAERNPILLTPCDKMELPPETIKLFNALYIDRIIDLMQMTREELQVLLGERQIDTAPVHAYLSRHGLSLSSHPQTTYKLSYDDPNMTDEGMISQTLKQALSMAEELLDDTSVPQDEACVRAIDILKEADRLALEGNADPRDHLELLTELLRCVTRHLWVFNGPEPDASLIAWRTVQLSRETQEKDSAILAINLYRAGRVAQYQDDPGKAISLFQQSKVIADKYDAKELPNLKMNVGLSLGECYHQLSQYDNAIKALGEAYDVCLSLAPPDEEMISLLTDALSTTYKAMGDMVSYTALKWSGSHHS